MSYQLLERPHKHVFSRNPVCYKFHITNPNSPGSSLQVELYCLSIVGGAEQLVTAQTLFPNPDGSVNFFCEDYLDSKLEWEFPPLANNAPFAVTKQIKQFYIKYRQVTKANSSPDWATDEDHKRIVLKGGIAKGKWDRNNFFINYLPDEKPFLTWQPANHFISKDERRYLTYFHWVDFSDDPSTFPKMKCVITYTDGSQDTVIVDIPLTDSLLFHLCVSISYIISLLPAPPAKDIWYFDVSVINNLDTITYVNVYRMFVDYRKFYGVFSFVYSNSLGGIDAVRIRGDYDEEMSLISTDIQQATGGDFSAEILPTENSSINTSKFETYKGDVGWLNTKRSQDALKDLLISDNVFRELFGRWLKVVLPQKSQTLGSSDDTTWSFPLQWRYTFDDVSHTPLNKDFGDGLNNELPGAVYGTCTPPTNLTVEFVSDDLGGKKFRMEWDVSGDAIEYELVIINSSGGESITPLADNFFENTFYDEDTYAWKVRSKCGDGDYSLYVFGSSFTVSLAAPVCSAPANVQTLLLDLTGNNAQIKFTWPAVGGVIGYVIEWREVGASVWNSVATNALDHTVILDKNIQYEVRVRSKCNATPDYSGYVYGTTFIPSNMIGACGAPTALAVFLHNVVGILRTVRFNWTAGVNDTTFTLQYKLTSAPNWTTISGINSNQYITALIKPGFYQWRVQADCVGGGISPTTNGVNFFT